MYEPSANQNVQPWYRQGWPWFLISLPASAVIGGIITIVLAVQSPNALVEDDYYKEGLAINQQKHRLAVANDMQLAGLLRSDGKTLTLQLTGSAPVSAQSLILRLIHSTRAELDRTLTLQVAADGHYAADLRSLRPGTWYLRLYPEDKSWEVRSSMTTDGPFQVYLSPEN